MFSASSRSSFGGRNKEETPVPLPASLGHRASLHGTRARGKESKGAADAINFIEKRCSGRREGRREAKSRGAVASDGGRRRRHRRTKRTQAFFFFSRTDIANERGCVCEVKRFSGLSLPDWGLMLIRKTKGRERSEGKDENKRLWSGVFSFSRSLSLSRPWTPKNTETPSPNVLPLSLSLPLSPSLSFADSCLESERRAREKERDRERSGDPRSSPRFSSSSPYLDPQRETSFRFFFVFKGGLSQAYRDK